jgi:glycosyltransferase involved in cell wall biosynthesis
LLERADGRIYPELARLAAEEPADLYIGHYPTGLAAASHAADRHHARLGYDVEDLYSDIYPATPAFARERGRILAIEHRYVGKCAYVSAVSAPAAEVFAERFRRERPVVVHNCHPLSDRKTIDGQTLQRSGTALSLYWFSQTVGLNRGIQDVIRAAGLVKIPMQLHLQGHADEAVTHELIALAADCGVPSLLRFHESVPPDELPSRAAEHHIGLALETDETLNRKLAVTNKLFLYFVSGLAVLASDLPGQRSVLAKSPEAGHLYPPGDFRILASHLDSWARHPRALEAARQASTRAGEEIWNWEREGEKVVAAVGRVFGDLKAAAEPTQERRVS